MMFHGVHDTIADSSERFALHQTLIPYYGGHPENRIFIAHAGRAWSTPNDRSTGV